MPEYISHMHDRSQKETKEEEEEVRKVNIRLSPMANRATGLDCLVPALELSLRSTRKES